ncbi:hypothetical protein BLNAU_7126 [Blattamonas nauphoetae]|uniref:Uncharacterized protein n=1 Tax=Blattamonas nauphoetae TaxID=2049346 RepID=A0ABQ9Y2K3_9EUKA|nr:hypothetical protein BLNAU_7126 [Blattamonas nauphoetae]
MARFGQHCAVCDLHQLRNQLIVFQNDSPFPESHSVESTLTFSVAATPALSPCSFVEDNASIDCDDCWMRDESRKNPTDAEKPTKRSPFYTAPFWKRMHRSMNGELPRLAIDRANSCLNFDVGALSTYA